MFEARRRKAKNGQNRVSWSEDNADDNDHKKNFLERLAGNSEPPGKTAVLDANVYATKKTIAQGLLDVALLTANASQLKYLLQVGKEHEFYYGMLTLISLSIILQMVLGSVLIIKGRCDINDTAQQKRADTLNDIVVCLVFADTIIQAFLSVFHIKPDTQKPFKDFEPNKSADSTENDES